MSGEREEVIQSLKEDDGFVEEDDVGPQAAIPVAAALVVIKKVGSAALNLLLTKKGLAELGRVAARIITSRRNAVDMSVRCPDGGSIQIEGRLTAKELEALIRTTCSRGSGIAAAETIGTGSAAP